MTTETYVQPPPASCAVRDLLGETEIGRRWLGPLEFSCPPYVEWLADNYPAMLRSLIDKEPHHQPGLWAMCGDLLEENGFGEPNSDIAHFFRSFGLTERLILTHGGVEFVFVLIPAGEAILGSPPNEPDRYADEKEHPYARGRFWMLAGHVTNEQWDAIGIPTVDDDGTVRRSNWDEPNMPRTDLLAREIIVFYIRCAEIWSNHFEVVNAPNVDEFEYAARGGMGNKRPFYWGHTLNGDKANCNGNFPYGTKIKGPYLGRTCESGRYMLAAGPQPYGLYDPYGNCWTWCWGGPQWISKPLAEERRNERDPFGNSVAVVVGAPTPMYAGLHSDFIPDQGQLRRHHVSFTASASPPVGGEPEAAPFGNSAGGDFSPTALAIGLFVGSGSPRPDSTPRTTDTASAVSASLPVGGEGEAPFGLSTAVALAPSDATLPPRTTNTAISAASGSPPVGGEGDDPFGNCGAAVDPATVIIADPRHGCVSRWDNDITASAVSASLPVGGEPEADPFGVCVADAGVGTRATAGPRSDTLLPTRYPDTVTTASALPPAGGEGDDPFGGCVGAVGTGGQLRADHRSDTFMTNRTDTAPVASGSLPVGGEADVFFELRGGGWFHEPSLCRPAYVAIRDMDNPVDRDRNCGLRIAARGR
jgi:formylglycine-generating enzyme required for sulfatase activity